MKALVQVGLKKTVLDPQGKTIQAALAKMGFPGIADLRQAKLFELTLHDGGDPAAIRAQVERAAREVLTNPVIEEYSIRWED
ncbi:MAG TPA: phosphoribosylformylglycinamidine synthase subunit PurS [Terriglobales bacterium]|nr:phosphoribosylformylglycinamidine synthase subunit PurS [Terriglobales bacterium]